MLRETGKKIVTVPVPICAYANKNEEKMDIGSVNFPHDSQVVKEIIGEVVSGALSQCEPTTFVPEFIEDVSFFILS